MNPSCRSPLTAVLVLLLAGGLTTETLSRENKVREILEQISPERLRHHVESLAAIHSRHVTSATIEQAWSYLRDEFQKHPGLEVELDEFEEEVARLGGKKVRMVNVVATLRGRTDPDRLLVVSGHYDSRASDPTDAHSRAPGAVDDASGTAVALELARVLSRYDFDATLVFIAFSGEEMGLLGSRHWAQRARRQGLHIEAMITNDIVGNSHGGAGHVSNTEMRVFSEGVPEAETEEQARLRRSIGGEVDSPARQLARYAKWIGEHYLPDFRVELIYRRDRFGRGGDHTPFSQAGYPAVRFSEKYENYRRQHQDVRVEQGIEYGDLPGYFDEEYAARIARVNAAILASLADAPPAPSRVAIGGAVQYDTTLKWQRVEASDLAGYRVLIRETSSPEWQKEVFVGDVDQVVLQGMIVDNFFFAVQAVDRDGNASLPVFPSQLLSP